MISWQTTLAILILMGLWRGRMIALREMGIEIFPTLFSWQNRILDIVIPGIAGLMTSSLITIGDPFTNLWLLLPWMVCWQISYLFTRGNKDRYVFYEHTNTPQLDEGSVPAKSLFDYEFDYNQTKTPR